MASDFAKELIKRHEGLRLKPYRDIMEYITIGYGHNLDGKGIPKRIADELFEEDIIDAEVSLGNIFGIEIFRESEKRVAALLDMVFNLGEFGMRGFIKMIEAVKQKDWQRAGLEARSSKWFSQVGTRGEEIIKLLREG